MWIYLNIQLIKEFIIVRQSTMDLFQFPDDYKPDKYLTTQEMDDITNYLKNHPLFMKELPEDVESNEHLAALQTFVEDEDPTEMAEDLNKQANNKLKESPNGVYHMKFAYKKYTQAIKIQCPSPEINAKLRANRASLNLKLKNYGKVIEDCKMCLKYNPNYLKGYYRYAKALISLQKYEETLTLLADRNEQQLKEFKETAELKLKQKKKIEEDKNKKKQQTKSQIMEYCLEKKWKLLKRDVPLPEGAQLKMIDGKLSIPLMVIYPQFSQFDLIVSSFEHQKIRNHLKELLQNGLPWDAKKQYTFDKVQLFCEISEAVMMKIPWQVKIEEIAKRVPIKGCIELHLVSKDNEFYNQFIGSYKII